MMYKIQTLNNISDVIHQSLTAERYLIAKEEPCRTAFWFAPPP